MVSSYEDFRLAIAATTREAFAEIGTGEVDADALAVLVIALFDGLLVQWQLQQDEVPDGPRLLAAAGDAALALARTAG